VTFDDARRLSEIVMSLAFMQQAAEHLAGAPRDRWWFVAQRALALGIVGGIVPVVLEGLLLLGSLGGLRRFNGPYNGGSDRMRVLVLCCVWASRLTSDPAWQRVALGYLAVQVVLSYTMAGWVKLANPDWRSGQALRDVFAFSTYPVSEGLRTWADWPRTLLTASWLMMMFELLFPLALADGLALQVALATALLFHLVNACVFGLNRFVWIWPAAFPCLLWFQHEILRRAP
jgi:uncharacterized membrane protein YphA (DoxX/SURF4 family)